MHNYASLGVGDGRLWLADNVEACKLDRNRKGIWVGAMWGPQLGAQATGKQGREGSDLSWDGRADSLSRDIRGSYILYVERGIRASTGSNIVLG